jgi:hypothetical protein
MNSLEKLSSFLGSFEPADPDYDSACFIMRKLADLSAAQKTLNDSVAPDMVDNTDEKTENLNIADTDKIKENYEGALMEPAFKDLENVEENETGESQTTQSNPVQILLQKIQNNKK